MTIISIRQSRRRDNSISSHSSCHLKQPNISMFGFSPVQRTNTLTSQTHFIKLRQQEKQSNYCLSSYTWNMCKYIQITYQTTDMEGPEYSISNQCGFTGATARFRFPSDWKIHTVKTYAYVRVIRVLGKKIANWCQATGVKMFSRCRGLSSHCVQWFFF